MSVPAEESVRWTPAQRRAIEIRGCDTLVSAAAGSGKTSVLVSRVIERVLDPVRPLSIDRALVVTFTESAAAEMRERIRNALQDALNGPQGRRAAVQLALVGKAPISTLHSFCLQILRRHYHVIGLDPRFSVLGEEESRLLKLDALERVFESVHQEAQDETGGTWPALIDHYGGRWDDRELRDIVLGLFEYVQSVPDGRRWLEGAVAAYESPRHGATWRAWEDALRRGALRALEQTLATLDAAIRLASLGAGPQGYRASFEAAAASVRTAQAALRDGAWDEARTALQCVVWPRLAPVKDADPGLQEEAKNLWQRAKDIVNAWRDGAFARTTGDYLGDLPRLAPVVRGVVALVERFGEVYDAAKRRQGVVDFADLERLALDVLERTGESGEGSLAEEYRRRFDEVLVDEYQDINPVQDRLLSLVSRRDEQGGNRFLVGDVKQSIYRFRLADPSIFQEKFHSFAVDTSGRATRIDLQENFRSRPEILAGVNFLFRQVMHAGTGAIVYGPDAWLRPGRTGGASAEAPVPIEVHLVERLEEPGTLGRWSGSGQGDAEGLPAWDELGLDAVEKEARVVAHLIHQCRAEAGLAFREIAVLMRSPKGRASAFVETLEAMGIPAYTRSAAGFFHAVEVEVMTSLLRLLDNARQDIPLAAVLRSPIVGLSSIELATIRARHPEGAFCEAVAAVAQAGASGTALDPLSRRMAAFMARLDAWRTAARRLPLSQLIRRIYQETGYVDYVAGLPRGRQREANLRGLYTRARQFDHFRTEGLDRFVQFVDDLDEAGEDLASVPALGEGEDVVQVMSVHQSKGLEFPAVFVVDLDRGFNMADTRRSLIFHRELGIGAAVIDRERHLRYPSLAHRAIAAQLVQDTLEEELRLLYVALTRAKERAYWVGSARDLERRSAAWAASARVEGWPLPPGTVLGARSWLDWIGAALARHRDGEALRALGAGALGSDFYRPVDREVYDDPARFNVTLWDAAGLAALAPSGAEGVRVSLPVKEMASGLPLGRAISPEVSEELGRLYGWTYAAADAVRTPAKVSVTEFARLAAVGDDPEDGAPVPGRETSPGLRDRRKPTGGATAAERGTATHRVLARCDLTRAGSADHLRDIARELVRREILKPEAADAVDVERAAQFFRSPLGRRVAAAAAESAGRASRVWREISFTMLVDAGALRGGLQPDEPGVASKESDPGSEGAGARAGADGVVMQGTIDCLVYDERGWLLLDYKTDHLTPAEGDPVLLSYRRQLEYYAAFIRQEAPRLAPRRDNRPGAGPSGGVGSGDPQDTIEAYLVFLHSGAMIPVELGGGKEAAS